MVKAPSKARKPSTSRRLAFGLIPSPLWGENLRTKLGRYQWRKLRKELLTGRSRVCDVCGAEVETDSDLKGHEQWEYLEKKRTWSTAKLIGIIFVCDLCHDAEHFGRIQRMQSSGELPDERVDQIIRHYCRVNGVTRADFRKDLADAMAEFQRQSRLTWLVDWGDYRKRVRAIRDARWERLSEAERKHRNLEARYRRAKKRLAEIRAEKALPRRKGRL